MSVCPFPTTQKFWKLFFFFFFLIFNFAFLNKIVKIKVSKYIVTVPKVYCVGTEGYVYPIHVSTRLFDVTYLNTENYICISLTSRFGGGRINLPTLPIFRPKGQTKDQPTDSPNFQAKRANKPLFFSHLIWNLSASFIVMISLIKVGYLHNPYISSPMRNQTTQLKILLEIKYPICENLKWIGGGGHSHMEVTGWADKTPKVGVFRWQIK